MRTLMLAENLPYPTMKGGDLRNWQNVQALLELGEVGVFGLCSNDHRTASPDARIAAWTATTDPDLARPPPPLRALRSARWLLEPRGHPADTCYSARAAEELEGFMHAFRPEVVVVERLWLHGYIAHARAQGARIVFDAHNLEAELGRQLACSAQEDGAPGQKLLQVLAQRAEAIEQNAVATVDQVWVCSERDRVRLRCAYPAAAEVHVVPNGVDVASHVPRSTGAPATSTTLVFPAMFGYAPNATAARFLLDELMPCLPHARLVLVGAMPTKSMQDAALRDPRIVVTGAVADVRPFVSAATAVVVPLFEGSGTRFKILEAMAAGVPVVTTPVGADGLDVEDGRHVLLARSAEEFAAAIAQLQADASLAPRLAAAGRALVAQRYSWAAAGAAVARALEALDGRQQRVPRATGRAEGPRTAKRTARSVQ